MVDVGGFVLVVRDVVAVEELLSERVIELSAVVEMERDFGPWVAAVPAREDNRDPGEPGLAIMPGTSRPPLCLCLMDVLDNFNGEAVADRAGGTTCDRLEGWLSITGTPEADDRLSARPRRSKDGGAASRDFDTRFFERAKDILCGRPAFDDVPDVELRDLDPTDLSEDEVDASSEDEVYPCIVDAVADIDDSRFPPVTEPVTEPATEPATEPEGIPN